MRRLAALLPATSLPRLARRRRQVSGDPVLASRAVFALCILALCFLGQAPISAAAQTVAAPAARAESEGFSTLDSARLAAMLRNKDFFLVNVHIPYEGEIEDTDANIAFDKLVENLGEFPSDKNAKIVLYCRSGRMSEIAAAELSRLGYTQVSHLSGGMIDWQKNGQKIIEKQGFDD